VRNEDSLDRVDLMLDSKLASDANHGESRSLRGEREDAKAGFLFLSQIIRPADFVAMALLGPGESRLGQMGGGR
jgi:hypothetical protein